MRGATVAYFYNREALDLLRIDKQTVDESQFIEIGDTLEFEGEKFVVKRINFKLEKELYKMDNELGIDLYSVNGASDFNCQIGVFVDNE